MTLFREDWLMLKEAVKRRLFIIDNRYKGMTYDEAEPYANARVEKMSLKEFEHFIESFGFTQCRTKS